MKKHRIVRHPSFGLLLAIIAVGCEGPRGDSPGLAVPDVAPARAALVATLDHWKKGGRDPSKLIGSKPAVGTVDTLRRERGLVEYEVVGPLAVVDKARPFAVRLVLDGPEESVTTRYLVMGNDPLWVFRQEDYELILHWEHKMPAEPPGTDRR